MQERKARFSNGYSCRKQKSKVGGPVEINKHLLKYGTQVLKNFQFLLVVFLDFLRIFPGNCISQKPTAWDVLVTMTGDLQSLVCGKMKHHSGKKTARKTKQNNGVFESVVNMAVFGRGYFLMFPLKENYRRIG